MTYIITDNNGYEINGNKLNEEMFQEELIGYQIRDRKAFTDNLTNWISEAKENKELMESDLKYLMELEDEFILSSIYTNEYICCSDSEEEFNNIIQEMLELNKTLKANT